MFSSCISLVSAALAICAVLLSSKQKVLARPLSILSALVALPVYYERGHYPKCVLNVIYVVLNVYGWHKWRHGGPHRTALPVSRISVREAGALTAVGVLGTVVLGLFFTKVFPSLDVSLTYWDSLHMAFAIAAQWLMVRKKIETWIVWVGLDVLYFFLCWRSDLPVFSALHVFYLIVAVYGYRSWSLSLRAQRPPHKGL